MLKVTISSFAYKNGLPTDDSGNGGGYVFDCRALANPYRDGKYRYFSGNMPEIEAFFLEHPSINSFITNVCALIDVSVENYLERKFTDLQINFGCTGGQHRSVYLAEQICKYLSDKYGNSLILQITHREQKNWLLQR